MDRRQFCAGAAALLSSPVLASGGTWEQDILAYLNVFRDEANQQELALHGYYRSGPRLPLKLHPTLTAASALWCRGLADLGFLEHYWWTDSQDRLVVSQTDSTPISRRAYPSEDYPGLGHITYWHSQIASFGLVTQGDSSNAGQFRRTSVENVVFGFKQSGYNADPWLAGGHYSNIVQPYWTHMGIAVGAGKMVVNDFARL